MGAREGERVIFTCAYGCVRSVRECKHLADDRRLIGDGKPPAWRVYNGCPTNAQLVEATGSDRELLKLVHRSGRSAQDPQRLHANGLRKDVLSVELFLEQGGEAAEGTISEAAANMWPSRTDRSPKRIRRALKRISGKSVRDLADETGLPKSTIHDVITRWKQELSVSKTDELLAKTAELHSRYEAALDGIEDVVKRVKEQFPTDEEVAEAVDAFLKDTQHQVSDRGR